jgi:hypothetical protein
MSSENEKWDLIEALELDSVKDRILNKKSFWWRWTQNNLDSIELEYRQFLYLAATNPTEIVVPWSEALDEFWHNHILDTVKYEKDCMAIFGKMFHHNPHLPAGSKEQVEGYSKTKKMYKESFGDRSSSNDAVGCSSMFIAVFCGSDPVVHESNSHHSETSSESSSHGHSSGCGHSHSDSGHSSSDSGGHSDGGSSAASCSGGSASSCGGGGCGGGGD